jgi:predicted transcriptional regulator
VPIPEALDVAKKSEKRKFNTLVRMDDDLCDRARKLAALRNMSMAEMFASVLRPWVDREWAKEVRKLKEGEGE